MSLGYLVESVSQRHISADLQDLDGLGCLAGAIAMKETVSGSGSLSPIVFPQTFRACVASPCLILRK